MFSHSHSRYDDGYSLSSSSRRRSHRDHRSRRDRSESSESDDYYRSNRKSSRRHRDYSDSDDDYHSRSSKRSVVDVPAHQSIAVAGIVDDIVTPAHGHGHGPVSVTTGTMAVTSPIVIRRKTEKIRKRNVTRVHLRMGPVMKENRRNHHLMY